MIGRPAETAALLERLLDRPVLKYHCIIHHTPRVSVWKIINLQHAMISVVKRVSKIRARR